LRLKTPLIRGKNTIIWGIEFIEINFLCGFLDFYVELKCV